MGSFIAGISVFCFAASYTVTLALEISRLWFRSGVRGAVMLAFAGAGLLAHVLFLSYRAYTAVTENPGAVSPLSSAFDYYLIAALALVIFYLYLTVYHPQAAIGLFLMPMVLALIAVARFFADDRPFPQEFATQVWGMLHGSFWLIGTVAMLFGFMAGMMYLLQSRRLKHKTPAPRGLKLPSLEWLERANSRAIVISVVGVGLGIISGLVLNLVNHRKQVDVLPWTDPVIMTSALLTLWVFTAAMFSWFYKPAQRGHKVAYLTVTTGIVLACHLAISLFAGTQHGSRQTSGRGEDGKAFESAPTGHRSIAQGCRASGYPGYSGHEEWRTPTGFRSAKFSRTQPTEPRWGSTVRASRQPRVAACAATLGYTTVPHWGTPAAQSIEQRYGLRTAFLPRPSILNPRPFPPRQEFA